MSLLTKSSKIMRKHPLHFLLLIDDSTSMSWTPPTPSPATRVTKALQEWLTSFAMAAQGKNYMALSIVAYGSVTQTLCEGEWLQEVDARELVFEGKGGSTNIVAAFDEAKRILSQPVRAAGAPPPGDWNAPWVLLFSDGSPDDRDRGLAAARSLRSTPTSTGDAPVVFCLGYGQQVDEQFLKQAASTPELFVGGIDADQLLVILTNLVGSFVSGKGLKDVFPNLPDELLSPHREIAGPSLPWRERAEARSHSRLPKRCGVRGGALSVAAHRLSEEAAPASRGAHANPRKRWVRVGGGVLSSPAFFETIGPLRGATPWRGPPKLQKNPASPSINTISSSLHRSEGCTTDRRGCT